MGPISKCTLPVIIVFVFAGSCSTKAPASFVRIKGGAFVNTRSTWYGKSIRMADFCLGVDEVTQKEWTAVMGYNPSHFRGDNLPVEMVSWYDCIDYCNRRSVKEGLRPYYTIDKHSKDPDNTNELDSIKWKVTINSGANGYRLPTEMEWAYAAEGGQLSKGFIYSGSDSIDDVAWYWKNSGDNDLTGSWSWSAVQQNNNKTQPVGRKAPNELGLYDMSGNVREWCWDSNGNDGTGQPPGRIWKGGGWMGADFCCASAFRAAYQANGKGPDQGLRVGRDAASSG